MSGESPSDTKLKGRQAALAVVAKLKGSDQKEPVEQPPIQLTGLDAVVEAIEQVAQRDFDLSGLQEALEATANKKPLDLSAVIAAIKAISVQQNVEFDASEIVAAIKAQSVDLSPIQGELEAVRFAIESNTAAVRELVAVAKTPRQVVYDTMGRVTEIKLKTE